MWREQMNKLSRGYAAMDLPAKESGNGPIVLHWGFIGGSIGLLNRDILFALAMRIRGGRPRIVLCDGVCSGCQIRTYSPKDSIIDWKRICKNCIMVGNRMVESAGIKPIWISELVSVKSLANARRMADTIPFNELKTFKLDGYDLGLFAMSAAIRYFRALPHAVEPEHLEQIFREYMFTALVSMHASQSALQDIQPDVYLTTHNIYSEWGPAYHTFMQSKIPVYWHIASILQGHIMIRRSNGDYTSHPYYCDDARWKELSRLPLTKSQESELDGFMDVMVRGKNSLMEYFGEEPQTCDQLRRRFNIPEDRKVWGIFSPLPWDAHLSADPLLFSDVDEWLVQSVKCAAEVKDVVWVVKMHPTESIRNSRMSMEKVLKSAFPVLPDNVRLISGENRINTFGLINLLDGGITTRGTTGMELALHGKQAMASGSSHFGFKGFTLDSLDIDSFFAHMQSAPNLGFLTSGQLTQARRYAYDFFIRRNLPFDVFDQTTMTLRRDVFKTLYGDRDTILSSMCDFMLHGEMGSVERLQKTS